MRDWQVKRRERTRHLIELGGLVVKAGLVELAEDDRAALYGAFLTVAAKLRGEEGANAVVLFRRKGKRAFDAEAEGAKRPGGSPAGA
jgi:Conjugal transfer protein TraD